MRKAEGFFTGTLGWRPLARPNNIGRPAAGLEITPGQELHLVEVAGFAPSPFEAEFGRHIAVAVPLADFDSLKHRLLAHGATLLDPERPTPLARFFFRDPDGYVFEVVAAERGSPQRRVHVPGPAGAGRHQLAGQTGHPLRRHPAEGPGPAGPGPDHGRRPC